MRMPYVCRGTIITTANGLRGKVICVDRKSKAVVFFNERGLFTEHLKNLQVVSYKEVE